MRVLVVEDETTLREQLVDRLREEGMVVDAAGDGRVGLYLGTEYEFDAAVVDLGLPELDGVSLIERLRAAQRRFPILILTARDRWQDKVTGLAALCVGAGMGTATIIERVNADGNPLRAGGAQPRIRPVPPHRPLLPGR